MKEIGQSYKNGNTFKETTMEGWRKINREFQAERPDI
jgi:hypothetical protein